MILSLSGHVSHLVFKKIVVLPRIVVVVVGSRCIRVRGRTLHLGAARVLGRNLRERGKTRRTLVALASEYAGLLGRERKYDDVICRLGELEQCEICYRSHQLWPYGIV